MENYKLLDLNSDWLQVRPSLEVDRFKVKFNGYQTYSFKNNSKLDEITPLNDDLIKKSSIILPELVRVVNENTTFLDLGCANYYFGMQCVRLKAKSVTGVEVDKEYVTRVRELFRYFDSENCEIVEQNIQDYSKKHDIVNALAIIHWLYSCSAAMGSLETTVKFIADLANEYAIIEWIGPEDPAIAYLHHISYNSELTRGDYTKENFLKYLAKNFKSYKWIGNTETTREIFFCTK